MDRRSVQCTESELVENDEHVRLFLQEGLQLCKLSTNFLQWSLHLERRTWQVCRHKLLKQVFNHTGNEIFLSGEVIMEIGNVVASSRRNISRPETLKSSLRNEVIRCLYQRSPPFIALRFGHDAFTKDLSGYGMNVLRGSLNVVHDFSLIK